MQTYYPETKPTIIICREHHICGKGIMMCHALCPVIHLVISLL